MNPFKKMWQTKRTRIFMIVCPLVLILCLVISLVITNVPIISGTLDIAFGGKRAITGENKQHYASDYETKAEAKEAAEKLGVDIVSEGITLLKNENNALPLKKNAKVTVFGKNSVNLVYGGSGSSASKSESNEGVYSSLEASGFTYNPTMKAFYDDKGKSGSGRSTSPNMGDIIAGFATGETPISSYTETQRQSYSQYRDAAIVVISRIGGEGYDLPRSMKTDYSADATKVEGARNKDDHYLQLDQNETDLLKEANDNFDKVIVVLNTAQIIETGFLDDTENYAYYPNIKACLWMGLPATKGALALGKVLSGEVNPSGHTVDTYARNFKNDPSYKNFGNNNTDGGNEYLVSGNKAGYYYVDYEEGIYVGYRYYETRYQQEKTKDPDTTWYKDNVVYPFGYGLSYTTFDWEIKWPDISDITSPDQEIKVEVKVTNTGSVAGKDVVSLYYTPFYTEGGIEKSYVNLAAFEKTSLLEPSSSETLTLSLLASDMKSYDYDDSNKNEFYGYELEKGRYDLHVASDAHTYKESHSFNVTENHQIDKDSKTKNKVENQFDDVSEGISSVMSRKSFETTYPTTPLEADRTKDTAFISSLSYKKDDSGKPWESTTMPTVASAEVSKENITVTLKDLVGKEYDDALWDTLLSQLTLDQMSKLIGTGAYGTVSIENISKPMTTEPDGPSGFTSFMALSDDAVVYGTAFYPAESVLGSTWNKKLAASMGKSIGNEGLIGNEKGDKLPYSGWYAPACNIHRSPFGGRNWEYYSEDPYLSGIMGTEVVKACKEKGVYCFVKHFAANDQETNRDSEGCLVWMDEQTMREIYLKPFEMIVKEGETTAMMSSFNRLGKTWAGGSYALLTSVLRKEWGFKGEVVTDYNLLRYMNVNQMIRAGGDLVLNQGNKAPTVKDADATQATAIYNSTHNILYTIANSNAMNAEILGYLLPKWQVVMFAVDYSLLGLMVIWGVAVTVSVFYKKKQKPDYESAKKEN